MTTENKRHPHEHYPVLDALRGCAAILVAQRHMAEDFWAGYRFFRTYLAVDLFFMLSGFVIAAAYSNRLESGELTTKRFMLIRWIRLYPTYFLATILAILAISPAFELAASTRGWHVWYSLGLTSVATFAFLPSHWLGGLNLFSLNTPYWSLFFELVINAAYAFVAKGLNNAKLIIVITLALFVAILTAFEMNTGFSGGWGWSWLHLLMGFGRSIFGICVGVLLYRQQNHLARALHLQKASHALWSIFIPVLAMALLATPSLEKLDIIFDVFVCSILFPLCILFATRVNWINHLFLLSCNILGAISYPIYVLHIPVSALIVLYAPTWGKENPVITGLAVLIFLLILSFVIEKNYDTPIRRLLTRRILKKQ